MKFAEITSLAAKLQIFAQFSLAFGSAFLGAILGWIVTQLLAVMRSSTAVSIRLVTCGGGQET
jgi:hypothetical protein